MENKPIVIRVLEVFRTPTPIIAGEVITSPPILPFGKPFWLYLPNGAVKTIIIKTEVTSSYEAYVRNLHGYTYEGEPPQKEDLAGITLISNLPYDETMALYQDYVTSRS